MSFLSYSLLYFYFLLLLSEETKLPKVWAKQHFMAEHLWKRPTARCVYFEFPWDTAKLLFKSQQETGVLLEVCGASFHWEAARCVWERGLNSSNSFWVIAVGFFTVGKRNQVRFSDTGIPSCCLTLGFTAFFSFPSLLPPPETCAGWTQKCCPDRSCLIPSTKPHSFGNKRQNIWGLCVVAAGRWQGHAPVSLLSGSRELDFPDSLG